MSTDYLVAIERGPASLAVRVPSLPGCIAVAESRAPVRKLVREGTEIHLDGMRADGIASRPPSFAGEMVRIAA